MELRNKLALLDDFFKPFSRQGALTLSNRQMRIYLILTVMFGAVGYLFLLLFPTLLVVMPVTLLYSVQSVMSTQQWFLVTVQVLFLFTGAVMTYTIFKLRFSLPSGLELTEDGFPRLFELLHELYEIYGEPRIDRVILRDRFDIRLIKTPRNGFAFSTTRTLVIGLPVLLAMSPLEVHVLLARRVGQLAGKHHRLNSWLYFLRDMWGHYLGCRDGRGSSFTKSVYAFFQNYVPRYRSFSVGVARSSELEADLYALQAINDRDTARSITNQVLAETYLVRSYWPNVLQSAKQSGGSKMSPHAGMAKVFQGGLSGDEVQAQLERIKRGGDIRKSAMPRLLDRLDNIGYQEPLLPKPLSVSAARFYLGSACDTCMEVIDKRSVSKLRSEVIKDFGSEDR
ncbi:MAG: hypothetical protein ACR2O5_04325 [Thiogranum sp.]